MSGAGLPRLAGTSAGALNACAIAGGSDDPLAAVDRIERTWAAVARADLVLLDRLVRAHPHALEARHAHGLVDPGDGRLALQPGLGQEFQRLRRGGRRLGHGVRDVLRALAGSGQEDPFRRCRHRSELGVLLDEKAVGPLAQQELVAHLAGVG